MFNDLTKQQQETLFMNEIDANAYRQMKETTEGTQYRILEHLNKCHRVWQHIKKQYFQTSQF